MSRQRALIVDRPLSVDNCVAAVKHEAAGAVVVMIGCVRNHTHKEGEKVAVHKLDYEAYVDMAEKVIAGIVHETEEKWPHTRGFVEHRIGTLGVGDLAVVVAVAAPHRGEAFDACRHIIDRLKEDAPIWKREHDEDGLTWVGMGP